MIEYKEWKDGFEWGPCSVSPISSDTENGWVLIGIQTPKHKGHEAIQLYVTKTGKVRVFSKDGEWLP